MEKFVPYEKLSKKEKRRLDRAKRQTWGDLNPVTRKPENSRAYNRKRAQKQWASALSFRLSKKAYFGAYRTAVGNGYGRSAVIFVLMLISLNQRVRKTHNAASLSF